MIIVFRRGSCQKDRICYSLWVGNADLLPLMLNLIRPLSLMLIIDIALPPLPHFYQSSSAMEVLPRGWLGPLRKDIPTYALGT